VRKFIIGHGLVTKGERRRDGVVFFAKFGDDVVDELVVGERGTGCCHDIAESLLKGICPRGNNKVVIIIFQVYDKCLFLMLELYSSKTLIHV
jgi:hypothetical protein